MLFRRLWKRYLLKGLRYEQVGSERKRRAAASGRLVEPLESRTLLSESASAQLHLVSTTGTNANPVFNYDITLTDTGTTNIGTFWFSWVPGADLLPSAPLSVSNPAGWANTLMGTNNSFDGTSIQWVAQSPGSALMPGQSLSGFDFSSPDSPAALSGQSPSHPSLPALTSFVYGGAPFSDSGFEFTVAGVPSSKMASATALATSAASVNAGDGVTFTATVSPANPGGATPTGTVSFLDNGAAIGMATLNNGKAVFSTRSLPVGTDSITASYGGDATYSASASSPVTETVSRPPINTATLAPTVVKSTLPSAVVAGAPVHGVITVLVNNPSSLPFKGPVTIDVFASPDGAIDGSATLLATLTRTLSLKAAKGAAVSVPIRSLPATLPNGTYTLLARAINPSSQAGDSPAGPTIKVAAPFISFSESFTRLTLPATVAGGSKTHATAALRITNSGNIAATGPTTIAIFASTDGAVDAGTTLIQSTTKVLRLRPGKSAVVSLPLTMIPALTPGRYFIVAQVTDPNHQTSSTTAGNTVDIS